MEARCVLVYLVLMGALAASEATKCVCQPPDEPPRPLYDLFPGLGYYKLHTNIKTWHEAKLICEKEGAHLAVINSRDEVEVLRELRRRLPNTIGNWEDDHCFIGMNDILREGVWRTVIDTSLIQTGFAEWNKGEPNGGTKENCGVLILSKGKMNDTPCGVRRAFFCEREL